MNVAIEAYVRLNDVISLINGLKVNADYLLSELGCGDYGLVSRCLAQAKELTSALEALESGLPISAGVTK